MNPGKCIVYLLLLFFAQPVFAQKKIVLEKIRSFAVNDPVITYWQKVETSKTIALQPSRTLVEHQLLPPADTTNVKIEFVLFDASLSPELLNRLFMIGFNRFFE
ncbi:MAG: hypothetical protein Q8L07_03865 [Sediminibacterium sp.]|nr:hypothetical protein [Sediminibacterium sp.]MDP1811818.1 hypothetical protein [Sediminibacterium sp.]MDP3127651.1 hypothetical protein [Sediminibacterium sp.]